MPLSVSIYIKIVLLHRTSIMKKSLLIALLILGACSSEKDYEVGYVTTGNPDNSYLDTTKLYCCGD